MFGRLLNMKHVSPVAFFALRRSILLFGVVNGIIIRRSRNGIHVTREHRLGQLTHGARARRKWNRFERLVGVVESRQVPDLMIRRK